MRPRKPGSLLQLTSNRKLKRLPIFSRYSECEMASWLKLRMLKWI